MSDFDLIFLRNIYSFPCWCYVRISIPWSPALQLWSTPSKLFVFRFQPSLPVYIPVLFDRFNLRRQLFCVHSGDQKIISFFLKGKYCTGFSFLPSPSLGSGQIVSKWIRVWTTTAPDFWKIQRCFQFEFWARRIETTFTRRDANKYVNLRLLPRFACKYRLQNFSQKIS